MMCIMCFCGFENTVKALWPSAEHTYRHEGINTSQSGDFFFFVGAFPGPGRAFEVFRNPFCSGKKNKNDERDVTKRLLREAIVILLYYSYY